MAWNPADHPRGPAGRFVEAFQSPEGVRTSLSGRGDVARLSMIRTDPESRGQGRAEEAMRQMTEQADREGVTLALNPEPLAGDTRTKKTRLRQWYRRHGFQPNTGRSRDFEISETMVRRPRRETNMARSITLQDDHSSRTHRPLKNKPGVSNWVEEAGGLPRYIKRVARHIRSDSGYTESRAIAAAISQTKKRAAEGNAEAIAAIAEWNRMKASTSDSASIHSQAIDLIREIPPPQPGRWRRFMRWVGVQTQP